MAVSYRTACVGKWHLGMNWPIGPGDEQFLGRETLEQIEQASAKAEEALTPTVEQLAAAGFYNARPIAGYKPPVPTIEQLAAWQRIFFQPIPDGPTAVGFDHYFGVDVPGYPPYCFIENDRTVGIPARFLRAEEILPAAMLGEWQGPAVKEWDFYAEMPAMIRHTCAYPHGEGMLLPARKSDPDWLALPDGDLYGGVHSYLMCLGLVDEPTGQGLLTLLPDVEATLVRWRDVPVAGQTIVAPQYICRSNKAALDRPWRMTFCFSDRGGYVALAERYREFLAAAGLHKTLREKAAVNPAVAEIAGAPIFWAAAHRPKEARDMADVLKAAGVDRCLFAMCNVPGRKPEEPEYQKEMAAGIRHVRRAWLPGLPLRPVPRRLRAQPCEAPQPPDQHQRLARQDRASAGRLDGGRIWKVKMRFRTRASGGGRCYTVAALRPCRSSRRKRLCRKSNSAASW